MQEYFIGSMRKSEPREADSEGVKDLNQPLIPPVPDFLIAISALITLRVRRTMIDTMNDIGNGRTSETINTVTTETKSQARYFFPNGLPLASLIDTIWPLYYLTGNRRP